jgi:hypothetical protein
VAATLHTFVTDLFFATSLRVTVNATHLPSGDILGPPMRESFCMSSTRNTWAANADDAKIIRASIRMDIFIFSPLHASALRNEQEFLS